jgi:VanZ family protein
VRSMYKNSSGSSGRLLLLAAVILMTLFAGLNPEEYNLRNNVRWSSDGNGLEFDIYGTAVTEPFVTESLANQIERDGFTLEIALDGVDRKQHGFASIVQFYSGDDTTNLVLGQWSDRLIMMNGDDYSHRLRTPRISFKLPKPTEGDHLFSVTSDARGTRFYFDGRLVVGKQDLVLVIPSAQQHGRLILGNSAYGINPWKGIVRGLALYKGASVAPEIEQRYDEWRETKRFSLVEVENSYAFYNFDERQRAIARDHSVNGNDLHFMENKVIVEKQFLEMPFLHFEVKRSSISDIFTNLFGFIPFAFVLSLVLHGFGIVRARNAAIVIFAAAALSFGIEGSQAWMPSRTSSALDLILNTMGAILGLAAFAVAGKRWSVPRKTDSTESS